MFKMRFAPLFDAYLPKPRISMFERVKAKWENPGYNCELVDYATANVNGVPLHNEGQTTLTPIYNTTLYCDVCELPVHSTKVHGKTRQLSTDRYSEINSDKFKREMEKGDGVIFAGLNKEVELKNIYNLQCNGCGRWVAKGKQHEECFDETNNACKYCGNIMKDIVKVKM